MIRYIGKRLVALTANMFVVTVLIFVALQVIPGDGIVEILGLEARPEQAEAFRAKHGLDKPAHEQFVTWFANVLRGDFGTSFRSDVRVSDEFMRRMPVTMEIVLLGTAFTITIGLVFGVISALRQDSAADYAVRLFAIAGLSVPNFFLLTLLLLIPAKLWGYAPRFGSLQILDDPIANLQLFGPPVFLISLSSAAVVMRLTRSSFLEVMRQDYVRTAYAKGLATRHVVLRHQMKNALGPVITLSGVQVANLMSGTIILEQIMGLPGLGLWALEAIRGGDYPVMMAFTMYSALIVMVVSLIVDLTYGWLDPRIQYS